MKCLFLLMVLSVTGCTSFERMLTNDKFVRLKPSTICRAICVELSEKYPDCRNGIAIVGNGKLRTCQAWVDLPDGRHYVPYCVYDLGMENRPMFRMHVMRPYLGNEVLAEMPMSTKLGYVTKSQPKAGQHLRRLNE